MLLAIDVGNTTVNVGIFNHVGPLHTVPLRVWKFATRKPASREYYSTKFKKILKNKRVENIIISSVVPDTTRMLKTIFRGDFGIKPAVLGENLTVPIKNLYKNPGQVGQDRLVNAYAGYKKFGGGLIIVDFGTAVTFDVVSKKGEYLGGVIFPGIKTSLDALSEKAALLPRIELRKAPLLIGKDTVTSMRSGIVNGFGVLCDGIVAKIIREVANDFKVILTGGDAETIFRFCDFDYFEPGLTLEGLHLIAIDKIQTL